MFPLSIDFQKAFDCMEHQYLQRALQKQGIEEKLMDMYKNSKACVKIDGVGKGFTVERGARQGNPLSLNLFNYVLEDIFREMDWEGRGIRIDGE